MGSGGDTLGTHVAAACCDGGGSKAVARLALWCLCTAPVWHSCQHVCTALTSASPCSPPHSCKQQQHGWPELRWVLLPNHAPRVIEIMHVKSFEHTQCTSITEAFKRSMWQFAVKQFYVMGRKNQAWLIDSLMVPCKSQPQSLVCTNVQMIHPIFVPQGVGQSQALFRRMCEQGCAGVSGS